MSKYDLVGIDGNAFSIMGYVSNALRREDLKDKIKEYQAKATSSDYDHLLAISIEYIDLANEAAIKNGYIEEDEE
jgi:hypothetical protein